MGDRCSMSSYLRVPKSEENLNELKWPENTRFIMCLLVCAPPTKCFWLQCPARQLGEDTCPACPIRRWQALKIFMHSHSSSYPEAKNIRDARHSLLDQIHSDVEHGVSQTPLLSNEAVHPFICANETTARAEQCAGECVVNYFHVVSVTSVCNSCFSCWNTCYTRLGLAQSSTFQTDRQTERTLTMLTAANNHSSPVAPKASGTRDTSHL